MPAPYPPPKPLSERMHGICTHAAMLLSEAEDRLVCAEAALEARLERAGAAPSAIADLQGDVADARDLIRKWQWRAEGMALIDPATWKGPE